ncbi:hypothetical protein M3I01_010750 [Marinomonas sp. RSW2]|uniref:Uncharacterized protein n=1 Tax=Marinomonas maritima TaxID=2940935 RepID=A0ABT5WG67_9GAMM|nr:hypothetical protein [Marinomonas maritima]MDE8603389.1 hypothetical protein [Marinomonas maritima]
MKGVVVSFFRVLEDISEWFFKVCENDYKQIFRGGIVLVGMCLVGLSQTMPLLLDHEYKAMELKFEFEYKSNIKIEDANCEEIYSLYKECNLAKYKESVTSASVKLLNTVLHGSFYFGMGMVIFSALGYALNVGSRKNESETKNVELKK